MNMIETEKGELMIMSLFDSLWNHMENFELNHQTNRHIKKPTMEDTHGTWIVILLITFKANYCSKGSFFTTNHGISFHFGDNKTTGDISARRNAAAKESLKDKKVVFQSIQL